MSINSQLAKLLRDAHFGGNWTGVCLRDRVSGVSYELATKQVEPFHPIATLVFHINYYIRATVRFLQGEALDAEDRLSFDHAPIQSEADWQALLQQTWDDAEALASLIEEMPETKLEETFVEERYGTHYRCLHGPIEHCYYHMGQISMIRKRLGVD